MGGFLRDRLSGDHPGLFDLLAGHRIETALDTGWPITGWTPETRTLCLGWVRHTQHLLMNEVEPLSLFEVSQVEDAMLAAVRIMPQGAHVIAKRGRLGASGLTGGSMIHVPAPAVKAVDTIGAGDVFNAGYLVAIARGESFDHAIAADVATASRAISTHPREYVPRPAQTQVSPQRVRDDVLQQFGEDLRESSQHACPGLIGSPKMNFLPGRLEPEAGGRGSAWRCRPAAPAPGAVRHVDRPGASPTARNPSLWPTVSCIRASMPYRCAGPCRRHGRGFGAGLKPWAALDRGPPRAAWSRT